MSENNTKDTKKKQPDFSYEQYTKVIESLNQIVNNPDTTYDNKREKNVLYLKAYIEHIGKLPLAESKKSFHTFLTMISDDVYKRYGDEFTEKLFTCYSSDEGIIVSHDSQTPYEYFLYLFFLNQPVLSTLINQKVVVIDPLAKIITINQELLKTVSVDSFTYNSNIIDLIILRIYSFSKIESFYTSITGELMGINSSVVKFYKVMSLFALCYFKMDKKENFIGSLLLISGGVMRDLARCYLKTRNVFNENLSYHIGKKDQKPHRALFFPARVILERDCDYLKDHFLVLMRQFINIILFDSVISKENNESKYWDDFISHFNSFSDDSSKTEYNEDIEKTIPPNVKMFCFITFFLCDLIFFFITNFSKNEYDDKSKNIHFISDFEGFGDLLTFTLSFISSHVRNVFNFWNFAYQYKRVLDMQVEQTEYLLKSKFNAYGVCFIMLLMLTKQFDSTKIYLPMIESKKMYEKSFIELLLFILSKENETDEKYYVYYGEMCVSIAKTLKSHNIFNCDENIKEELKKGFEKAKIKEEIIKEIFSS